MQDTAMNKYSFEVGMYRPPSEGGSFSLLLRFTRNCPWNKCLFCSMYKQETFSQRSEAEIKQDIDSIAQLCTDLQRLSEKLGHGGVINRAVIIAMIEKMPELNYSDTFVMVLNWISSGGKTVFLQDANSLVMATDKLVSVLTYLRKTLPSIERVTTYARSKTLARKPLDELVAIREAGLDRLHVGFETGDDTLLKITKKGVTAKEHIAGGRKAMEAGFQLSEYWMPGLGGKEMWENHAKNTARVLSHIDPHYIRSRPFNTPPGTPVEDEQGSRRLALLSPQEHLMELQLMVDNLEVTSKLCFDHAGNYWVNRKGGLLFSQSYEGYQFPEEKQHVLDLIEEGIIAQEGRADPRLFRTFH
jgi:radical SAM superfamily enzyme YgiQ (UPF0313 family)